MKYKTNLILDDEFEKINEMIKNESKKNQKSQK